MTKYKIYNMDSLIKCLKYHRTKYGSNLYLQKYLNFSLIKLGRLFELMNNYRNFYSKGEQLSIYNYPDINTLFKGNLTETFRQKSHDSNEFEKRYYNFINKFIKFINEIVDDKYEIYYNFNNKTCLAKLSLEDKKEILNAYQEANKKKQKIIQEQQIKMIEKENEKESNNNLNDVRERSKFHKENKLFYYEILLSEFNNKNLLEKIIFMFFDYLYAPFIYKGVPFYIDNKGNILLGEKFDNLFLKKFPQGNNIYNQIIYGVDVNNIKNHINIPFLNYIYISIFISELEKYIKNNNKSIEEIVDNYDHLKKIKVNTIHNLGQYVGVLEENLGSSILSVFINNNKNSLTKEKKNKEKYEYYYKLKKEVYKTLKKKNLYYYNYNNQNFIIFDFKNLNNIKISLKKK